MAMNRQEITQLDVNDELVETYLVEQMQMKHRATVAEKRLSLALDANDELQREITELRAQAADVTSKEEGSAVDDVLEGETVGA